MLKRIQQITNIGRINKTHSRTAVHDLGKKVILIYGPNCYGKSTIVDIFRSFHKNAPHFILKRRTVNSNDDPFVKISFLNSNENREIQIIFSNNKWNTPNNFPYNLEIFDNSFIEENIFTGSEINREHKENLTKVVLGDVGVDLANKIAGIKRKITEVNGKRDDLEGMLNNRLETLNLKLDLNNFIDFDHEIDIENLKRKKETLTRETERLKRIIKLSQKISRIQPLKGIDLLELCSQIKEMLEDLKFLVNCSFDSINENALKKLKHHIDKHFKEKEGAEEWIKKGTEFCNDKACPFCGQSLEKVKDIIEIYKNYFSESYKEYLSKLHHTFDNTEIRLRKIESKASVLNSQLSENLAIAKEIEAYYILDAKESIEAYCELIGKIKEEVSGIRKILDRINEEFQRIKDEKSKAVTEILESYNISKIEDLLNKHSNTVKQLQDNLLDITKVLNEEINQLKSNAISPDDIYKKLEQLRNELYQCEIDEKRFEYLEEIEEYKNLLEERRRLFEEKDKLQEELEKYQTDFIERYFVAVCKVFKRLAGDEKFVITSRQSKRGYERAIELQIKFDGSDITPDSLRYFFSESDKRALAFSIFMAKLGSLDRNVKENTIVILDDPVTSFDENRADLVIGEIRKIVKEFRQVIILSHNSSFLKKLAGGLANDDVVILEIIHENNETIFSPISNVDIRFNPYLQSLEDIFLFCDGKININPGDAKTRLRKILQTELENRYRHIIRDEKFEGIGKIIDFLENNKYISGERVSKLRYYASVLNPESHHFEDDNIENARKLANDLINFVYNQL